MRSFLLILASTLTLQASTIAFTYSVQGPQPVYALDGPLGQERYYLNGKLAYDGGGARAILWNATDQVIVEGFGDYVGPRWYTFNYGRGEGDYYLGVEWTNPIVPQLYWNNPQNIPWITLPPGHQVNVYDFIGGTLETLSNDGVVSGFLTYLVTSWPNGSDDGNTPVYAYENFSLSYDMGANPYYGSPGVQEIHNPEPSDLILIASGLTGLYFLKRSQRES